MRILVINPNTSKAMTDEIGKAARGVASPGMEIVAVNPDDGPESIEGHYDDTYAAVGVLNCIRDHRNANIDGYLIACGNDPALLAAREMVSVPVLGIGEAALHAASMLGGRFSVITTLARTNAQIEDNIRRYGMMAHCRAVHAVDLPVLDISGDDAYRKMSDAVSMTAEKDGAETIVLACAGMASMARRLTLEKGLPVIDGVQAGIRLLEALVGLGAKTTKVRSFAEPRPKLYRGLFSYAAPLTDKMENQSND